MKRRIETEDFARIKYVSDPRISSDGTQVAYVVTEVLLDEKRYRSHIWLVGTDGGEPIQLTRGDGKDTSPRWSPDGQAIAFLTDRWGKNQIARLDLSGGEAHQVTDLTDGVSEFDWTSSGRGFLFAAKANEKGVLTHQSDDEKTDESSDNSGDDVKVTTTLFHKLDGSGFSDGRRTHIGVALQSGRIIQLTAGDYDHAHPALSPCRRYLAFSSNRGPNRDDERFRDIWILDLDTDSLRQVTNGKGVYGLPSFSPDSTKLAFVGHPLLEPYGPTNLDRVWATNLEEGGITCVSKMIDRETSNTCTGDSSYVTPTQRPIWSPDSQSVLALMSDRGRVPVVSISLDGTWSTVVEGDRETGNFSISENGSMAFTSSDALQPFEVSVTSLSSPGDAKKLTNHNDDFLETVELAAPIHRPYPAEDGAEIDAWLLEPIGRRDGAKYPLIVEIHGGPHSMYGHTYLHEFQLLAAQGYGVVYTNPRGSTGYGQEFVSAAMGDWGGVDYRDIMAGIDAVCDSFDWIDTNRIGVTGGSFGGFMVNWMITQTDRFKAAVTQRSTCNRLNLFGTSDLAWSYSAWEFSGYPWESPGVYYDRSPISYVDRVTTPLLIMHSENDLRCPIEQSEQLFVALKQLDKTVEFVRFPEESHNLSRSGRPDRRRERLRWMLNWFGRYL
jgi:dipeptidyl aminopeptidase/acylaminoacyl peptidase